MGTWGTGPFDNDDAADWATEVATANDLAALLQATCESVFAESYVEIDIGNRAVAAAAWAVSAVSGTSGADDQRGPQRPSSSITAAMAQQLAEALQRVLGPGSEWRDLWEEIGDDTPIANAEGHLTVLRRIS